MNDETAITTGATPTVTDVDEWLQLGEQLRKQLLEERARLAARIEEIDAKLQKMQTGREAREPVVSPPVVRQETLPAAVRSNGARTIGGARVIVAPHASVPELVRAILRAHPRGLLATEIMSEAHSLRPDIDPRNVHSALQRSSWVSKSGKARKYRYFEDSSDKGDGE